MSTPLRDDVVSDGYRWMDLRCSQCDDVMGWISGTGNVDCMCNDCMDDRVWKSYRPELDERWYNAAASTNELTATAMLAREVQEWRALGDEAIRSREAYRKVYAMCPTCPTCFGGRWVPSMHPLVGAEFQEPCPDCTDGKMPLAEWVALLVESLRMVALAADEGPIERGRALGHIDLVLKMVSGS